MTAEAQYVVAVVDDDHRVLESVQGLLESAGHKVHVYASAQALLEHRSFADIDCLISDIGMPVIDGFELQRMAKAARPGLPIILITARDDLKSLQAAAEQGGQGFLRKPFYAHDLLVAVGKAMLNSFPRR